MNEIKKRKEIFYEEEENKKSEKKFPGPISIPNKLGLTLRMYASFSACRQNRKWFFSSLLFQTTLPTFHEHIPFPFVCPRHSLPYADDCKVKVLRHSLPIPLNFKPPAFSHIEMPIHIHSNYHILVCFFTHTQKSILTQPNFGFCEPFFLSCRKNINFYALRMSASHRSGGWKKPADKNAFYVDGRKKNLENVVKDFFSLLLCSFYVTRACFDDV